MERELDRLIAERVMGWHDFAESPLNGRLLGLREGETRPRDGRTGNHREVPYFNTDIEDAWQILARIPMTVYAPHASHADGEYENGERWGAEAVHPACGPTNPYAAITADGDTAPEAICRCALLWVEAKSRLQ